MNNFVIAIPTYKRYDTLINKTLKLILKHNIDPSIVYIFFGSEEEKLEYNKVLPKDYNCNMIIGSIGMKNIRNFITNYFDKDQKIFFIDDDIKDIYKLIDNKLVSIDNLFNFIDESFKKCIELKSKIWSVYPICNPYFMNDKILTNGLYYMMGGCYGVINNKSLVSVDNKEDFERSIQYYLDSENTIRFNSYCCDTKGYTGSGGMNSKEFTRDYKTLLDACNILLKKYPKYCSLKLDKKSNKPEVKLNKKPLVPKPYRIIKSIDPSELSQLYDILESTKFHMNHHRANNSGIGYTEPMGLVIRRPQKVGEVIRVMNSLFTTANPDLYEEIDILAKLFNIPYTTIQVNKNYCTKKHLDMANSDDVDSYLFSLGDYTGGQLIIEDYDNKEHYVDTNCNIIAFNGSKHYHWNEPHKGTKYSIVFYNNKRVIELLKNI